ncbi:DUF1659 domain-containing protein [Anaerosphaera multitolerans]|uniref:DUF1659 domain-containing protein n=1 Tax=Anaerosphaera multitolerans TaxID=2487351 RepID=A0A437S810_9FIRM|nr:DUF1659 domain-containing protein [Anaerosphaera multitolerans]RVU55048.1 DUF1659 domain-containing protein [Anaerosphaera multitolerans]
MAVENILSTKLKVEFDDGFYDSGKQKLKTKTFSNVNPQAELSALYNTAESLGNFSTREALGFKKVVESELVEG